MNLQDRVAIVTGGSRGIGKVIVEALAEEGCKVVVNYRSSQYEADDLVAHLKEKGCEAIAVKGDVSDLEEAKTVVEETIQAFGKVDILVNNAGITRDKTLKRLGEEDWNKVIEVNLNSVYHTSSMALPYLLQSDNARIINISSIIGQKGNIGQTNYAAAKAGMIGFTKSLALELGKTNVTVNAICPGFIETEMLTEVPTEIREKICATIPKRRFGSTREIARGVIYLCKDGEYITGQQLNINGGLYM
ncbi:MAG: 3-oxoacyl-ACP reductase [Bacillaceae bacterium]